MREAGLGVLHRVWPWTIIQGWGWVDVRVSFLVFTLIVVPPYSSEVATLSHIVKHQ